MPHDAALAASASTGLTETIPVKWQVPLAHLGVVWAALFVLTWQDWAAMFRQWWDISTYNHVLFVPAIIAWLVYQRWHELKQIAPRAWWPGLLPLGAALLLWMLGTMVGLNSASQLGAVAALQSAILLLLGPKVALASLFPLAFSVFLVPFGDELVPALQMITATLVIALTEWSGIPAVIDGVFIDTPVGLFEVAEACSGVKFLIAMIALGTLISYACFTSWKRRLAFMAAAILLPVIANGVRAWGTIYIAQSQGIEFAEGFDHIFYGWVFFALVVAALIGGAWRWFDRDPDDLGIDFPSAQESDTLDRVAAWQTGSKRALAMALVMTALVGIWSLLASRVEAQLPRQIFLPQVDGWTQVDYEPEVPWQPKASGADHRLLGRYRSQSGDEVDVFFALYSAQEEGREASAYGEGAFDPDSDWRWLGAARSAADFHAADLLAWGRYKRRVETSFRTGSLTTGSASRLKLANMRDRMTLSARPTMLLVVSSVTVDDRDPEQSIEKFRSAIGDEGEWMDRIAGLR